MLHNVIFFIEKEVIIHVLFLFDNIVSYSYIKGGHCVKEFNAMPSFQYYLFTSIVASGSLLILISSSCCCREINIVDTP